MAKVRDAYDRAVSATDLPADPEQAPGTGTADSAEATPASAPGRDLDLAGPPAEVDRWT